MVVDFSTEKGNWSFVKLPERFIRDDGWSINQTQLALNIYNSIYDRVEDHFIELNDLFSVIGFVKDLTEEDWSKVVDSTIKCNMCDWIGSEEELKTFTDLSDNNISHDISYFTGCPNCTTDNYLMNTAKESGESLMDSLEVYLENPVSYPENPEDQGCIDAWQHCGERSGSWLLIQYN